MKKLIARAVCLCLLPVGIYGQEKGKTEEQRKTEELKEVRVTAKKPFIEQKIDRIVVNVSASIIGSGSTALDVLEKTPGVTVDQQNDILSLRGKEGVIVQIDGKQTYLPAEQVVSMLRSMSAANIDRIEIITNPSAKYDAAGNAGIIDIRLKKNTNLGSNGNISVGAGTGRYDRERASLQLNHKTKSLNVFASYAWNRGGNYWDFAIKRNQVDGAERNIIDQNSFIKFRTGGHNLKAGLDYMAGKRTTIGVAWSAFFTDVEETSPAFADFRRQAGADPYLKTVTEKTLSTSSSNQLLNFNVQHTLPRTGAQLSADLDYGRFERDFSNTLRTSTLFPIQPPASESGLLSNMPTGIDIYTGRVDYSRTYKTGWNFQAGVKTSDVRSRNDMRISRGEDGQLALDSSLSNNFKYLERVNAVYGNVNGKIDDKTEVQAGLRVEHTHSNAHSITHSKQVKRDYLNVFPSVFISRSLPKNQSLVFSYSHRINRPNYQNLNPVRSYIDPYAFSVGNAFLKPDYTHSLELKHGYKGKIFTSVGASFTRDMIFFVVRPIDNKTTERTPENIGRMQSYNFTLTFPMTVMQGWTVQYSAIAYYSRFKYEYMNRVFNVDQFSGRLNVSNAFVLGKEWTAELNGWVTTPGVQALYRQQANGMLDVGVQKVLTKSLRAKLTLQDIFRSNQVRSKINTPDFQTSTNIEFDSRVVMLNITYQFGNQQMKSGKPRKVASEDEMKRLE